MGGHWRHAITLITDCAAVQSCRPEQNSTVLWRRRLAPSVSMPAREAPRRRRHLRAFSGATGVDDEGGLRRCWSERRRPTAPPSPRMRRYRPGWVANEPVRQPHRATIQHTSRSCARPQHRSACSSVGDARSASATIPRVDGDHPGALGLNPRPGAAGVVVPIRTALLRGSRLGPVPPLVVVVCRLPS